MYKKEERYEFTYAVPTAEGNKREKTIYPKSKEKVAECKQKCQEYGYDVISVKKLYPFNTYKNQHNFELIANICFNRMHDMEMGEIPWNDKEFDELEARKDKADRFFCLPLPVAWIPWDEWQEAKEMATAAIIHRQDACIANGRPDLVTYC